MLIHWWFISVTGSYFLHKVQVEFTTLRQPIFCRMEEILRGSAIDFVYLMPVPDTASLHYAITIHTLRTALVLKLSPPVGDFVEI